MTVTTQKCHWTRFCMPKLNNACTIKVIPAGITWHVVAFILCYNICSQDYKYEHTFTLLEGSVW